MRTIFQISLLFFLLFGCKSARDLVEAPATSPSKKPATFVIAFGSCNKHDAENPYWDDILDARPDVWIWGGDNIYADTDDMAKMRAMYEAQKKVDGYAKLTKKVEVIGTWDDHDYGLNDGGDEFEKKRESQQIFLDFMGVADTSTRRNRDGVYAAHQYKVGHKTVKILVLDTRFFRSELKKDPKPDRRYRPSAYGEGTVLGEAQWQWLESELRNSNADFNILVTSIQFLSSEHGFEKWANFPHEVDRMKKLIVDSKAQGVLFLSGDRHISEFSKMNLGGLSYPLIDFTSSGLTHSYADFSGEPNSHRVGEVVSQTSFGLVTLDLENHSAFFQIMGENGTVLQALSQQY